MEINNSSINKSDSMVWGSDDLQSPGHVKSYSCAFCKRGFSNAQALGGHMNIHRKDRAKLKQASEEGLLTLDITRSTNPVDHRQVSEDKNLALLESSDERSSTPKRPNPLSTDDDATPRNKGGSEELLQLQLFVDMTVDDSPLGDEEKKVQLSHGWSQAELDLELRLGTEPQETSKRSTREFF